MSSFGSALWSSVGKKVITGLTGFLLVGFVIVHLLGNLTLFIGPDAFNGYAHFLETAVHGWLIYAFEAGLLVIFAFHIAAAVTVAVTDKLAARKQGYKYAKNAGGRSRKTLASRSMIISGVVIAVFVIAHIFMFKFNAGNAFEKDANGTKNLFKVVVTAFKDPAFTAFTVVAMILLGMHLRHGAWSAFQSLGWTNDRWLPFLTRAALVVSIVLAVGFILLPVVLFINGDPNAVSHGGH
ncbi:MAG: succinate dehydrogenase cytochrome b subunit [bacterium]|nr:succinate dehydrogenase cytochrome b subunit [bacterium]